MKLKEKRHAYLQKTALDKVIHELIGDYGTYSIYDWGVLAFNFDEEKLKTLEKLEFNLPSKEQIIGEAKKIYKNFDYSNIKNIQYNFSDLGCIGYGYKNQKLILNANGSNVKLSSSSFKSIEIKDANKVYVDCKSLSDIKIKSKYVCLCDNNNTLNVLDLECDEIKVRSFICLHAKKIIFKAPKIDLGNSKLDAQMIILRTKTMRSYRIYPDDLLGELRGEKIVIDADFLDIEDTILEAKEAVIIKNKSCTSVQSICSPKIVYNDKDISNNDEIVIQKLKQRLIQDLKEIKNNVNNNIESYVANEQFVKILKK